MRRLTHFVVLAAFIFSCGGQWYALQGVAWIKMIHDYSQMVPFTEAVSMTLSGKYPCEICKAIAEKQSSEQQKSLALEKYEKKFTPPLELTLTNHLSAVTFHYAAYVSALSGRTETPPTPPPRSALA
jgi:hypothetical protein